MTDSSPSPTKSIKTAYLYWLFLGMLGIHRFYLGKKISASILLFLTMVWGISYLNSSQEAFGILALIDMLGPLQDWLLSFGKIGKWISAMIFLPILLFPAIWWLTDSFRIPRLFKEWQKNEY